MKAFANAPGLQPPMAGPKTNAPSPSRARVKGARAEVMDKDYDERRRKAITERALRPVRAKAAVNTGYGDLIAAARAAPARAPVQAARAPVVEKDEEARSRGAIAQRATQPGTARAAVDFGYGDLIAAAPATAPRGPDATGIPAPVRAKMEGALDADFSDVRVHPGSARAAKLGALAFTQGSEIHVAPGQWAPETTKGQELLGHELGHVLQQRAGRVRATAQLKGVGLNDEPALEAEADAMGARAARGDAARERTPFARGHLGEVSEERGGDGSRLDFLYSPALEIDERPSKNKAACAACGGAPAGTGDCPACKAARALPAVQSAAIVQRECDPSIASCPFEDPGTSSSSSEPNASVPPPVASGAPRRWPNQTCENEILDQLQAAMHIACDTERSTCNPNKVSQKRLDRLDCDEVARRLAANQACLDARRLIQTTCFGGVPDPRHVGPLDQAERAVGHCQTLLQRCRERERQRQPVPVPVPQPAPAPEEQPAPSNETQPEPEPHSGLPSLEQVLDVLAVLGLSLALAAAIIAAIADPEPASKVALAVGSASLAVMILQRLGIRPEPGFEGA